MAGVVAGAVGLRCANPTYGICGEAGPLKTKEVGPHEMRPLQLKTKTKPWIPDRGLSSTFVIGDRG